MPRIPFSTPRMKEIFARGSLRARTHLKVLACLCLDPTTVLAQGVPFLIVLPPSGDTIRYIRRRRRLDGC